MTSGARFREFHERQRDFRACRCAECKAWWDAKEGEAAVVSAALSASDVAVGAETEREPAAAAPPFAPLGGFEFDEPPIEPPLPGEPYLRP
jgi:hypothetical protein